MILWRRQYLARFPNARESIPAFITIDKGLEGQIDEETIAAKIAAETEKERTRPGAQPYVDPI